MHCPHCRAELSQFKPVTDPRRVKLHAHHGAMDLDAEQLHSLARTAMAHLGLRRRMLEAVGALEHYREIVERMELDPYFCEHVLAFDGDGGAGLFPGAARRARLSHLKERVRQGRAREGDLMRYLELTDRA
ncbi:hypothetical protein NNJEOMEG_01441 [Fundidesulfovibrio magnetotacticus]|uniref:Uncharacterized protein n=1 Tax=Fundidesulfovibrio magnetotacticus TaxID=2730080 RepID=A0A6V8LVB0_9BACT|nr:hypothetical protein [Fundidesulfovibrio magnetotacticus]GFK93607.1 hypothetical protein NNJEOMEG_01441 [Fundidesulfovibrio magnetotacticus]